MATWWARLWWWLSKRDYILAVAYCHGHDLMAMVERERNPEAALSDQEEQRA